MGPWSEEACTTMPLDDRSFPRSAGWAAGGVPRDYGGTILTSSTGGAWLRLEGLRPPGRDHRPRSRGRRQVRAYWRGKFVKTIDLDEKPAEYRDVYSVFNLSSVQTGTLEVRVMGGTGPVRIDGVAIRR